MLAKMCMYQGKVGSGFPNWAYQNQIVFKQMGFKKIAVFFSRYRIDFENSNSNKDKKYLALRQFTKYSCFLEARSFFGKIELFLIPLFRNSTTHLTLGVCRKEGRIDKKYRTLLKNSSADNAMEKPQLSQDNFLLDFLTPQ